jgi:hypothetical protein
LKGAGPGKNSPCRKTSGEILLNVDRFSICRQDHARVFERFVHLSFFAGKKPGKT